MKNWIAKIDWDRVIAAHQFILSAFFLPSVFQGILALIKGQHVDGMGVLCLFTVLAALNLVAAWLLLSRTQIGYQLSLVNILLQIPTVKSLAFSYIYHGVFWTYVGFGTESGIRNLYIGLNGGKGGMSISAGEPTPSSSIAPLFTIDLVAIAAVIYLFCRWQSTKLKSLSN